jgi:hypothetical protein
MNADELGREAAHFPGNGLGAVESGTQETIRFLEEAAGGWSLRSKIEALAALLIAIAAVLVWALWPAKPVPEDLTPAPQVQQADGSMLAARAPDAHPAPPPHMIPKGFKEVRRDTVTVAPSAAAAASGCPPVSVSLSLVRNGSEQRVVASSPDGQVIAATDIPIEAAQLPPPPKPWAAGLSYDTRHAVGMWVDRDVGRLVLGAALSRLPDGKTEAQLRVGVRF